MGIREIIERARQAQQENPQMHPVQLEIGAQPDMVFLPVLIDGEEHADYEINEGQRLELIGYIDGVPNFTYVEWASDEERMEHFRATTLKHPLPSVAPQGARAGSPSYGGVKSARDKEKVTEPIPGRPGWRVDSEGREWYSAAWL
jgi:hypothetical protein